MNKFLPIYDKVAAGGTAGLVTTVVVGVLVAAHITLPAAVVAAIVTLVMFAASYLKAEAKLPAVASFEHRVEQFADPILKAMESEGPVRPKAGE